MRLIDADDLKDGLCRECNFYGRKECLEEKGEECNWDSIGHINAAKTIDAVPVRHGKWINSDEYHVCYPTICSICNAKVHICIIGEGCGSVMTSYCPCCGAKMDEEAKTDETD